MEVIAISKSVRISPRKVRIVADAVRKMPVDAALRTLMLLHKRGAYAITKTLESAIANAVNNAKLSRENLIIASLEINAGPFLKRFHASTRGRVHSYKKRSSHIKVVLTEREKKDGTKS